MRNYFFTRGLWWTVEYFDDMHVSQGTVQLQAIGEDDDDLVSEKDTANENFKNSLPPTWTTEPTYPADPITIYFTLDKSSFMVIAKQFAGQFVLDAYFNHPPLFSVLANPEKSPRYTGWTDSDGVKRQPAPTDKTSKGSGGDIGLLQTLEIMLTNAVNSGPAFLVQEIGHLIQHILDGTVTQAEVTKVFDDYAKVF
jgi:hypothetical protein